MKKITRDQKKSQATRTAGGKWLRRIKLVNTSDDNIYDKLSQLRLEGVQLATCGLRRFTYAAETNVAQRICINPQKHISAKVRILVHSITVVKLGIL